MAVGIDIRPADETGIEILTYVLRGIHFIKIAFGMNRSSSSDNSYLKFQRVFCQEQRLKRVDHYGQFVRFFRANTFLYRTRMRAMR